MWTRWQRHFGADRRHQVPVIPLETELTLVEYAQILRCKLSSLSLEQISPPAVEGRQIVKIVIHDRHFGKPRAEQLDIRHQPGREASRDVRNHHDEIRPFESCSELLE